MSLFLPSNLSPNFEEIIDNSKEIDFKFQVNTNGSLVRAYKLEILNDKMMPIRQKIIFQQRFMEILILHYIINKYTHCHQKKQRLRKR